MQMLAQTRPVKTNRAQQWAVNNGDVFKALSIFVHGFNLPFLFWFINCCIRRVWKLCYCCCPLAVCLDQLWVILTGVDWSLQMSAYNLLIPFISGCCCRSMCISVCMCGLCVCLHAEVFVKDRWGWAVVLEMSRSHLHWSPRPKGRGGWCVCVFVASIFP